MSIDVVVYTWPNHPRRLEYFRQTIDALRTNLTATGHDLRFHVSAEIDAPSDGCGRRVELEDECHKRSLPLIWRFGPADIGAHLNAIWRTSDADMLLLIQDDWVLTRPLDLGPVADLLLRDFIKPLGGVRFVANTQYSGKQWCISGFTLVINNANWSYGDNPALWHRRFYDTLGPFSEGEKLFGMHECKMSEKLAASDLRVLVPNEVVANAAHWFKHIGDVTSVPNDQRNPDSQALREATK